MPLKLAAHERIWLQDRVEFTEDWLQSVIADDPSILGLGPLELLERERRQRAGRLDLLLAAPGGSPRYEVELMLGATDPDHIVRRVVEHVKPDDETR